MGPSARARQVAQLLARERPEPRCELDYRSPWELLVATILSAQCTDERVNRVTPELFERWPGPAELRGAATEELEAVIRPTGFFRNKARSLQTLAQALTEAHGGEVPRDLETLVKLPGIGRKTANIVLGEAYGIPSGIAVDTHVRRVSRRLGLTEADRPERIEQDLEAAIDRRQWPAFSMRLVLHGRYVCTARSPKCDVCPLEGLCPRIGV